MPRLDPTLERWLLVAGWSAIVILWHTTVAAVALATWRAWHPRASAPAQYRGALAALAACVALAAATPFALGSARVGGTLVEPARVSPSAASASSRTVVSAPPALPVVHRGEVRSAATWMGILWCVASGIALVRLAGGWALAGWIRRRATPLPGSVARASVADVSVSWRLPTAMLLVSGHVEAPVVLGHWVPAILLPSNAARHIDPEAMAPLIAHELAHVARADYAVNLAQSIAEALLVFSPAVHWIARRIRDAREYCCDDLVVAHCGPQPYAQALATLAGLGAAPVTRPVLNVAGPRLIDRIERVLKEDAMTPVSVLRVIGLVGAIVLSAVAGSQLVPLSAAAVAQGAAPAVGAIPFAYPFEQEGANVALRAFASTPISVCGTATIQNQADVALTGVRFAAVLSAVGERAPLLVQFSDEIPVDVPSQAVVTVAANLVRAADVPTRPTRGRLQATCMLAQVHFANGHEWGIEPVTAQAIDIRFRFPKVDIPRAIIGVAPTSGNPNVCLDDQTRPYSLGAIVGVRFEPGRFARCVDGRWDDTTIDGTAGAPTVVLDLSLPEGPTPRLTVRAGEMAHLDYRARQWGLVPTIEDAARRLVRVDVYDLGKDAREPVATVVAEPDAPATRSDALPFTLRVKMS